ncbi:MAG: hypothetical protein NPINA01_28260 [Nitrospinaceae bacterium]|nr:MAG: hypothetical protein NPINA01_28260 [Nitrospinaceae bacterium]
MKSLNLFSLVLLCVLMGSNASAEDKKYFKNRIEQLENRVKQLESEKSQKASPSGSERASGSTTATGISRYFNPAISVNGLLLGTYTNRGRNDASREVKTGMKIQEVEMRFTANIDSYLTGDLTIAFEGDEVEIEEIIASLLVTNNLAFRAGKFFTPFGKHNLLHTHNFPFIDAPLINEEILGEEGINEVGVGASVLLPTPWFSEVNLQILEGDNALFSGPLNDDFLYLAHWKNLIDLTRELTAELGGSFAYGRNDLITGPYNHTTLAGADMTFKWKPAGREKYRTLIWQTEFMNSSKNIDKKGIYTLVQHQFARRWWVQGRYDFLTLPRDAVGGGEVKQDKHRYAGLLAFVLSEFSALRLQYSFLDSSIAENEHQVLLQLNFTFGSHPAHSY